MKFAHYRRIASPRKCALVDSDPRSADVYRKGAEAVAQKIRALADVEKDIRAAGKAERAA